MDKHKQKKEIPFPVIKDGVEKFVRDTYGFKTPVRYHKPTYETLLLAVIGAAMAWNAKHKTDGLPEHSRLLGNYLGVTDGFLFLETHCKDKAFIKQRENLRRVNETFYSWAQRHNYSAAA